MPEVRSSQLITTFGIGQLINFPDNICLTVSGLDNWDAAYQNVGDSLNIREPRLEEQLGVGFFRKPPSKIEGQSLRAYRFPQIYYCSNQGCGAVSKLPINGVGNYNCIRNGCNGRMLPFRFVAVCAKGHMEDIPMLEWVHRGAPANNNCTYETLEISLNPGAGDLAGIAINCTNCNQRRTLQGITQDNALKDLDIHCSGKKPWLGNDENGQIHSEHCQEPSKVVLRSSASLHRPVVYSALYLPAEDADQEIAHILYLNIPALIHQMVIENPHGEEVRNYFRQEIINRGLAHNNLDAVIEHFSGLIEPQENNQPANQDEQIDEQQENNQPANQDEQIDTRIKHPEYNYIQLPEVNSDEFKSQSFTNFEGFTNQDLLTKHFSCFTKIERVKETRAFVGFERLQTRGTPLNELKAQLRINEVDNNWLPAYEVYGEGFFLKFDDDNFKEWEEKNNDKDPFNRILNNYNDQGDYFTNRQLGVGFLVLHTFAHLLINRLSYRAGYSAASIRERIFYSSEENNRMNAVMIYTSSGDSDGSLGGLVKQASKENLSRIISEALLEAEWCSADPVCSDIGEEQGQGIGNINGAACHNCSLLPETSCEEFNLLLDRTAVLDYFNDVI
jgi:hypothetical protein